MNADDIHRAFVAGFDCGTTMKFYTAEEAFEHWYHSLDPKYGTFGPKDFMPKLKGEKESYRCGCGCNVFRKSDKGYYRCNSCKAVFKGE